MLDPSRRTAAPSLFRPGILPPGTVLAAFLVLFLLPCCQSAFSQTIAGSISGTVTDPQHAVIPHANVTARSEETGATTGVITDTSGHFIFPVLPPGHYTITVSAPAFKTLKKTGVILHADSVLTLPEMQMTVGSTVQTVAVHAQAQNVNTETAQITSTVVGKQIQSLQVNGQSPLSFLSLVPGVHNPTSYVESSQSWGSIYVNGGRQDSLHITVNGGTNEDTGANNGWDASVSLDAIQEFKVLTSSYQAQYGRSSGAQVSIVTKSGTSQFHGMGFEYYRDHGLNANSWSNNLIGLPTAPYHYNDAGFNLGGPIYIPGHFNTDRSKLFFFVDEEWQHQLIPSGQHQLTVPTSAERNGNFSSAVDKDGNPVTIRDPGTGQPFAGNAIPPSALDGPGVSLLNLLPLPNASDPSHPSYNYVSQISLQHPRREDLVRLDYNPNSKWRFYASFLNTTDHEVTPYGQWGVTNVPLYNLQYQIPGYHYVLNATTIISPTAVNEITVDQGHNAQHNGLPAETGNWTRSKSGVNLNTLYKPYDDLMAGFNFAGTRIGNSPAFNTGNFPFYNSNTNTEVSDNFSKTINSHLIKLGIYIDHDWKVQPSGANYAGSYDFGDDPSNPLDSGYGFANAALGVFDSFQQASAYASAYPTYNQIEWYAQDTWKTTPRLSIDYGVRFYYLQPVHTSNGSLSNFFGGTWQSSQAPLLLRPAFGAAAGNRVAIDPSTGQTYPSVDIGSYFAGSASPMNGLLAIKTGYITDSPGVLIAPRIGFSFDLTGHQNTILHVGGGVFYNRAPTDPYASLAGNPPETVQPTVNYGRIGDLGSQAAIFSPPALWGVSASSSIPTTYNLNVGIQSKLPFGMVGDVSYVGSLSNHQLQYMNVNPVPFGADFQPQNQDPTLQALQPNALLGSNALLPQFLRQYTGYGDINERMFSGNSNYNALQISLQRRVASGLFFGLSYTWSKCLDTTDSDSDAIRFDQYTHTALYGPCGTSVPQSLVINYVYNVPSLPTGLGGFNNRFTRAIFNHWQVSGISTFQSGTPFGVNLDVAGVSGLNITGTPSWGPAPVCIGDPSAGISGSPFNRINASAFAVPAVGSIGLGCSRNFMYGPGISDWDVSLQKNIPLTERVRLELRGEAFNIFNHTQFSGVQNTIDFSGLNSPVVTNLPFNANGVLVNTGGFGAVSGSRSPRILQLVAKIVF
ncbi:MAG: carboxypeptidase regulatory-like domain-containing protein [Terriglobia bacterium]